VPLRVSLKGGVIMIELALNGVVKYFGAVQVLSNVTFEVQTKERVGIVGANGSGKTTILKIIAGIESLDKGDMFVKKGLTLGYLNQIPEYSEDYSVEEVLSKAFDSLKPLEIKMNNLEEKLENSDESTFGEKEFQSILNKYSEVQHLYEASGGYEKEEKLSKVCTGLDFKEDFLRQKFRSLSGGEKTRVVLGKILLENPDILLLDEPTNHLDMDTLEWLEGYLNTYKGIVVIVSHDRYFLDRVVTKIVEVEDMETTTYKGNYTHYVNEKENNMMLQFEAFQEQQKKIKAMEKAIKDLRDWAIRADNNKFFRRAASMQKRLDKMERIDKPILEKQNMKINFNAADRSGNEVVKVKELCKSFGHKELFLNGEIFIRYAERVALIGPNGSGKSTLLKILLNKEAADKGNAVLGASTKIGYLPQQINFKDEDKSIVECFREDIEILEGKAREYLSKFMFFGEMVYRKVKNLSGGEKSRLMLAKLLYEEVNLLILDEPTNHLDIDSIETLEETLINFKGTILFISHDRYFINKISTRVVSLENKGFVSYEGNYEYYKEKKIQLLAERSKANLVDRTISPQVKKNKPVIVKSEDEKANKKAQEKKGQLEEDIATLELQIKSIEEEMFLIEYDYEKLNECEQKKRLLTSKLDELMELWIDM